MKINTEKVKKLKEETQKKLNQYQQELQNTPSANYSDPKVVELAKKVSSLQQTLDKISDLEKLYSQLLQAQQLLSDPTTPKDLLELAQLEVDDLAPKVTALYNELFNPKPNIDNFILEIRAGAGGEEAALFARDLFRMYSIFLQEIGAKVDISDISYSDQDGYRFLSAYIKGENAYYWFQFESGVHRVQRVPVTESSGRIHTSTVSVAILPEYKEEVDVNIPPSDLEITPIKASGPGGQHVNKNLTAIRIKHIPTGLIVTSQRYKSQQQNKVFALKLLKLKLTQQLRQQQLQKISDLRKQQIGTMDRSEKIRTYNYPQNRLTDHRIKKSWYNLDEILNGALRPVLEEIVTRLAQQDTEKQNK